MLSDLWCAMQVEQLIGMPFVDELGIQCFHTLVTGLIPQRNVWKEFHPWVLYVEDILEPIVQVHMEKMDSCGPAQALSLQELRLAVRVAQKSRICVEPVLVCGVMDHLLTGIGVGLFEGLTFLHRQPIDT